MDKRFKYHIDVEEFKELFINQNKTRKQVAKHFGVSERYVKFFCGKHNIKKPMELVQQGIERCNLERYGAKRPMQTELGRANFKKAIRTKNEAKRQEQLQWAENYQKERGRKPSAQAIAEHFNLGVGAIYQRRCRGYETGAAKWASYYELKVRDFLDAIDVKYRMHDRLIIKPQELDFLCGKIAIEVDDVSTHNSDKATAGDTKEPNYHLKKTLACQEKGIQLVHITSYEILNNWSAVENKLRALFCKNNIRIYARECHIVEITSKAYREFLRLSHIDGAISSTYKYGIIKDNELLAVAGFSKPRYKSHGAEYELIRFACRENITVVGGVSKLISHFRKEHSGAILSYSDKAYSSGNVYREIGFEHVAETKPNYAWYSIDSKIKITNRYLNRVGYDRIFGTDYGKGTSNTKLMLQSGFVRMYDCGNDVWVLQ